MVVHMFMKINKHLISTNIKKIVSLDNKTWESQIPKRPSLRLYNEGEEEEKKATSDNENEPVWGRSPLFVAMPPV
jgi:hypothetical protein